jgi:2,4-dienoyl-CoA reductase-like NADH-dependent reductase (Old Yellow Enzyme family)
MTSPFAALELRNLRIPNRLWMSPMCTYSAAPEGRLVGAPTDFHLAHYAARAAGGAGLVMVEATGVNPAGRISAWDLGLWNDDQAQAFGRLTSAIAEAGAVPAIQLAHAGRKASVDKPWLGGEQLTEDRHGWPTQGPSPVAFPGYTAPSEMSTEDIANVVQDFAAAAKRALTAGFKAVEIHAAHGYLLHSFLSPLSNRRTDSYGGDLTGRSRIVIEIIDAVRSVWPANLPVFLRVSTTDWIEENPDLQDASWTIRDTIALSHAATQHGVDLIDASSGGLVPTPIPRDRDYQTRYAQQLRSHVDAPVAAVGRIDDPLWAAELLESGHADALFIGRALLRDASWPNNAAAALGSEARYLEQYSYAV